MAFNGRIITLKRVIRPASFHQIRSTPLMVTPSISVANSRTHGVVPEGGSALPAVLSYRRLSSSDVLLGGFPKALQSRR
jgi:hypothetical protein